MIVFIHSQALIFSEQKAYKKDSANHLNVPLIVDDSGKVLVTVHSAMFAKAVKAETTDAPPTTSSDATTLNPLAASTSAPAVPAEPKLASSNHVNIHTVTNPLKIVEIDPYSSSTPRTPPLGESTTTSSLPALDPNILDPNCPSGLIGGSGGLPQILPQPYQGPIKEDFNFEMDTPVRDGESFFCEAQLYIPMTSLVNPTPTAPQVQSPPTKPQDTPTPAAPPQPPQNLKACNQPEIDPWGLTPPADANPSPTPVSPSGLGANGGGCSSAPSPEVARAEFMHHPVVLQQSQQPIAPALTLSNINPMLQYGFGLVPPAPAINQNFQFPNFPLTAPVPNGMDTGNMGDFLYHAWLMYQANNAGGMPPGLGGNARAGPSFDPSPN